MKNDLCENCGVGIEEAPGGCGCKIECKTALHKVDIFRGKEFIRVHNLIEVLKQIDHGMTLDYIDSFNDGYICGFHAVVKALEKDLNG